MGHGEACAGRITKGYKKILWGDGYVYYLDFADSFMGYIYLYIYAHTYIYMYICQNIKLYTLNICNLLYVDYHSTKL